MIYIKCGHRIISICIISVFFFARIYKKYVSLWRIFIANLNNRIKRLCILVKRNVECCVKYVSR